jgi:phage FluMu protein Com
MAFFRCNKCGHLREVSNDFIGKSVKCPHCKQVSTTYDTVVFVEKLIEKYLFQRNELRQLQKECKVVDEVFIDNQSQLSFDGVDFFNTTAFTEYNQYLPIINWFQDKKIKIDVDPKQLDTTGFYDEIAVNLGNRYDVLKEVTDQIKRIQKKGYVNLNIPLAKKSQKEVKEVVEFCQALYEYSFVARYFYQKQEKIIRLTLQTIPAIVSFFNGIWLEWFVFVKLTEFLRNKKCSFACTRNISVTFSNDDHYELDVFFLVNGRIPICIECKTGEFRQDIDKYSNLRKRLHVDKAQFLLCVIGLSQEQIQGLTSMYDLTFVNEKNFLEQVERLIQ